MMKNQKPGSKRYRFSVPDADESVIEWIQVQSNLSYSVRTLIKDYVSRRGYTDATCGQPGRKSPGRPTNEQRERMSQVEANYDAPPITETYETTPHSVQPVAVMPASQGQAVAASAPMAVSPQQMAYHPPESMTQVPVNPVVSAPAPSVAAVPMDSIDDMDDDMSNYFTKNRRR